MSLSRTYYIKVSITTISAFIVASVLVGCGNKLPPAPSGCKASFTGVQCQILMNGSTMVADSFILAYDTVRKRMRLYARDLINGATLSININAPLQNLAIPMQSVDAYGKGKTNFIWDNKVYTSEYGNITLNVRDGAGGKTVCGNFFAYDKGEFKISQGEFRGVPVIRTGL